MTLLLAMCLYSLSMSISPGPVNLITLSTGMNHGFRRALPFVSGATLGFTLLLALTGLGLGELARQPLLLRALGLAGTLFIGYLGYRIATAPAASVAREASRPGFWQGALLQWLNPKAWVACLAGVSAFDLAGAPARLALFVTLYGIICYLSIGAWALLGARLERRLPRDRWLRYGNLGLGTALIAVALYLLAGQLGIA